MTALNETGYYRNRLLFRQYTVTYVQTLQYTTLYDCIPTSISNISNQVPISYFFQFY